LLTHQADDGPVRSTVDRDRRLVRRAALHLALLKGDTLGIARAWDRLRVSGAAIHPEEAEAARAARAAVGHALRDARWRRTHDDDHFGFRLGTERSAPPRLTLARGPARVLAAATAVVLLAVIALLYQPIAPGGLQPAAQAQTAAPAVPGAGRGRTSATLAPVVLASPVPGAATQAPPPDPSLRTGPGSGSGLGAGILPPKPDTDDRFIFVVLDSQTVKPLSGVCVAYGGGCDRRRSDPQGYWWIDFPRGGALADKWRFVFVLDGYQLESKEVRYVPGEVNAPVHIFLRRVP
jgi:hypothetical protein